jgi:type I restriction enzyme, S subunit
MNELPTGWARAALGDATTVRKEKEDPRNLPNLPFIGLEEVEAHTGRIISTQNTSTLKSAVALFAKGDILYGRLRPYLNKVVIPDFAGAASAEFIVLPGSKLLEPRYLQCVLMSPTFVEFTALKSTGDRPRVSYESISPYVFPLPPIKEQGRIVAKIDSLSAKSKRARDHLDHIPRLVEKYKQAILAAAFRGELTREWRRNNGVPELLPVTAEISIPYTEAFSAPSSWQALKFADVCEIVGGSQPPKSTFKYEPASHLIRLVQIRDYKSNDHITFIPKTLARRFCSADDIMIGRYGPPIFQILRGIEGAYNVALMKAMPVPSLIEREFLYWYLQHPSLRSYVEFEAERTAGQDGVNKRHLLQWPVLLPPLQEQSEIVKKIEIAFAWVSRIFSEADSASKLIDHLDQAVLAKAFRGELVPQDPNDEPASVLLERIRAERAAEPGKVKARGPKQFVRQS